MRETKIVNERRTIPKSFASAAKAAFILRITARLPFVPQGKRPFPDKAEVVSMRPGCRGTINACRAKNRMQILIIPIEGIGGPQGSMRFNALCGRHRHVKGRRPSRKHRISALQKNQMQIPRRFVRLRQAGLLGMTINSCFAVRANSREDESRQTESVREWR